MKKFVFSLQRVLDYKEQILGLLKSELSRLQLNRKEIEKKIQNAELEFDNTNRNLVVKMKGGMTRTEIAAHKCYLEEINRKILALQEDLRKAMEAIAAKQREIVQMNSDISGLKHLKEHQLDAYRSEERKEQETLVEEFVGRAKSVCGVNSGEVAV